MRRLAARISDGSRLDIGVFGCSKGAEVYSIAWTLKAAPPNLKINIHASDISPDIVEFARQGIYSRHEIRVSVRQLIRKGFRGGEIALGHSKRSVERVDLRPHVPD
jgi:chemotaxis methyl-accepting protein methylase